MSEDVEIDPEVLKKQMQAGKISAEALVLGKGMIKEGVLLKDVADKVESYILSKGAGLAFPCNISLNKVAAHYAPPPGDETVFGKDIVKLDCGAHVDGYIGDNALTVDLTGENSELVKASREALNNVLKMIQIGTSLGEIGKTVHETITSYGFKPVVNLSGHQVKQFHLHAGLSVPNYDTGDETPIQKGMFLAIEPFASSGAGRIEERGGAYIHSIAGKKPVRSAVTREVLKLINTYQGLPFTTRWLSDKFPVFKVNFALNELKRAGILRSYAPLLDVNGGLVSQAENTVFIGDKIKVITKVDDD